jgi:hypothetical protein
MNSPALSLPHFSLATGPAALSLVWPGGPTGNHHDGEGGPEPRDSRELSLSDSVRV